MCSIIVYNKMSIDTRDIYVEECSTGSRYTVKPGNNSPALSFGIGESLIITMSNGNVTLPNGCWITVPGCSNYEFPTKPPVSSQGIYNSKKVLIIGPHQPNWQLKITNQSCTLEVLKPDNPPEPNITVGDNQGKLQQICEQGIEPLVIRVIACLSGYDPAYIKPGMDLGIDLGLTAYQRKALAVPFLKIAKTYNPNASITRSQCQGLKTVKEAINLVKKVACIQADPKVVE